MKTVLTVKNADVTLKGLKWEVASPKANVVILEGMEEHSSRYNPFATFLNKKGFNAYCIDTFGQGENVDEKYTNRGIWPKGGFVKFVDVVNSFIEELKHHKIPTYVFAHSMGSFMGQYLIQTYPNVVDKIVLCGAGSKKGILGLGHFLAKLVTNKKSEHQKAKMLNKLMFGNFNNRIKNPETPYDWLSYNKENVKTYIADPLSGFGPNNGFCLEFIEGMLKLNDKKKMQNLNKGLKIFIITGEEDPVTDYSKATGVLKELYQNHGVKNVVTKIYPHTRHEILNEDIKETVFEDIYQFFKE